MSDNTTEAPESRALSPDVLATLEEAGDALATALVGPLVGKVEQARDLAARLEGELALCRAHLTAMTNYVTSQGGPTWAQDAKTYAEALAFLEVTE